MTLILLTSLVCIDVFAFWTKIYDWLALNFIKIIITIKDINNKIYFFILLYLDNIVLNNYIYYFNEMRWKYIINMNQSYI